MDDFSNKVYIAKYDPEKGRKLEQFNNNRKTWKSF